MKLKTTNIKPYSAIKETGANCPCVKHFFRCTETSGNTLTCAKTGLIWTPAELAFDATLKTVQPNHTTRDTYGNTDIDWQSFGTKYIAHIAVVRLLVSDDYRCSIGNGSPSAGLGNIGASGVGSLHTDIIGADANTGWLADGSPTVMTTREGLDTVIISKHTPYSGGVSTQFIECLDEQGQTLSLSETRSPAIDPGIVIPHPTARWSGAKFYGAAWFAFTAGFPSDFDVWIKWMAGSWLSGHEGRYIYPGALGVQ